jgi:hypothetical protein
VRLALLICALRHSVSFPRFVFLSHSHRIAPIVCAAIADSQNDIHWRDFHVCETIYRFPPWPRAPAHRSRRRPETAGLLFCETRLLQGEERLLSGGLQARLLRKGAEVLRREQGVLCLCSTVFHKRLGPLRRGEDLLCSHEGGRNGRQLLHDEVGLLR